MRPRPRRRRGRARRPALRPDGARSRWRTPWPGFFVFSVCVSLSLSLSLSFSVYIHIYIYRGKCIYVYTYIKHICVYMYYGLLLLVVQSMFWLVVFGSSLFVLFIQRDCLSCWCLLACLLSYPCSGGPGNYKHCQRCSMDSATKSH